MPRYLAWLCVAAALASACNDRSAPAGGASSGMAPPQPPSSSSPVSSHHRPIDDAPPSMPRGCAVADQPGFNHYTVAAINDASRWPKNGTYPYCWDKRGEHCRGHWGFVHDAPYCGGTLFEGGGDCYCSGHSLEVFLRAYRLWQQDHGVPEAAPFEVNGYQLLPGDVGRYGEWGGVFYQLWQGFGCASEASSASAFDAFGIGRELSRDEWDKAMPGDFVNFSRQNGSGHAVLFVGWVERNGLRIGIRYYGCNSKGDSCPDPKDPANVAIRGGPSFNTERFAAHGGQILRSRLHVGRPAMPTTPH